MRTADFSPRDWNKASTYTSPGQTPGLMVLDFERLSALAREAEGSGSFHMSADGTFGRAPLFIDDLPASFYRIRTGHPDFTPNVNSSDRETLVVVEGALRIVSNAGGHDRGHPDAQRALLATGGIVELSDEPISMQAIYMQSSASSLAVGMYRDLDQDVQREIKIV